MPSFLAGIVANLPALPPKSAQTSKNPFKLLGELNALQWAFFLVGVLAWTVDAIDFFGVSLSVSRLSVRYGVSTTAVTTSITLTLLFRSLGAVVFGLASDRFGRRMPLVLNLSLISVLSLSTAFCTTFSQFLAVRALFGIAMGGIWGGAVSTALENMPVAPRGIASGILQQGYAVGYLLAAVLNLTLVPQYNDYRVLFYFGAATSIFTAALRLALPESQYFLNRRAAEVATASGVSSSRKTKIFIMETGKALRFHWVRCIYAVLLMTCFNTLSHGSQDLFPTILQKSKGLTARDATLATIIGNVGAVVGGLLSGYISQYAGRRITIIGCCVWTLCFLPLWLLPNTFNALAAGAFFLQMGVQGAWGVIPVYLTEISPVAFRATFPGVVYQIGNMISSASAQIEATAGEHIKTPSGAPDYGKVSTILIGVVASFIVILCIFGREDHSAQFELGKAAFEEGAGQDVVRHEEANAEKGESDFVDNSSATDEIKEKN